MKSLQRWLVLPDTQIPYEDVRTLKAVESYMKDVAKSDHPFDGWLQLGDFLDFNELSKYNAGYEASIKEDVAETFAAGNRFLDRQQAIVRAGNKRAKFVLLQGNHDFRAVDYALKFPFLRGILDYEKNLKLKARGIKFVKCWENKSQMFRLGKACFIHGNKVSTNHAKQMCEVYGANIFYGHLHDVQEYSKQVVGKDKVISAKSLGCLCRHDQQYLRGNPTNWVQAFSEFWVLPDGFFTEHTVKIFKHRFVAPNGKVYQG
jgi:uncharacterized Fe-S cluster protein YjdI